jgi:hypothetical protein
LEVLHAGRKNKTSIMHFLHINFNFFQPKNLDPDPDLPKSLEPDPECYEYGSATQLKYCGCGPDLIYNDFFIYTVNYAYTIVSVAGLDVLHGGLKNKYTACFFTGFTKKPGSGSKFYEHGSATQRFRSRYNARGFFLLRTSIDMCKCCRLDNCYPTAERTGQPAGGQRRG